MRILMISDVYFPRINGVSTSIKTFRDKFRERGHEVSLIAPTYPGGPHGDDDEGIIRIPARRVLFDPEDRMMRGGAIRRLTGALRQSRFDLIHVQTPFVAHYLGVALARRLGVPCVETYHTFFEEYLYNYVPLLPSRWLRALARTFTRRQCNAVSGVVVPSPPMMEVLGRYGVTGDITVVPTGIEPHRFSNGDGARFRTRYGIGPHRPTLTHVGRIAHEKNIDFLLHVLVRVRQSIPNVLLVIAGEGPALKHLQRLTTELGLRENVLFVGYLDRNGELPDCYRAGDAFVFASRTETQGLVLLEAMACGVPVVSTAVMGTSDILAPRQGALVADEDVDDFAHKTVTLLNDRPLRDRLGREAREYAAEWSPEALADRMLECYRTLIQGAAATSGPPASTRLSQPVNPERD